MGELRVNPQIAAYWQLMQKYHDAVSLVGKRYILEVEMSKFLLDNEHPRVEALLSEFIKNELRKIG